MLWAPVTYDAEKRHRFGLSKSCAQLADRYEKLATALFRAVISVTRARPRVGLPGISNGPHAARYDPTPASSNRRLVIGDCHVSWWFCTSVRRYPAVSGDDVAVRPPRPSDP